MSLAGITEGETLPALGPNDSLCTPPWLWGIVASFLGPIDLDPCASEASSVIASHYCYGPQKGGTDGLAVAWDGLAFVNPPYGRGHLRSWARKCVEEAARGTEIVLLVPVSPSTVWWQTCLTSVRAIAYLNDRVRFDGGKHGSGMFDSAVLYWGNRPHLFLHSFHRIADQRLVR